MRSIRHILLVGAAACLLVPAMAQAQATDSASLSGMASATLVRPESIVKLEDLRFGAFMRPTAFSTITIAPNGTVTGSATIAANMTIAQPAAGRGPASFLITGTPNRLYLVQTPNQINISNGSATMQVRNFSINSLPGPRQFDGTGQSDLRVGGQLRVNGNQAPGQYSGNFTITVIFL